jgi:ketosteroid isomerase-like protein
MTNKEIIREVIKGFIAFDIEAILKHVADDVQWFIPGEPSVTGKEAFAREVSKSFNGRLEIKTTTEIADGDYVVIEGEVESSPENGTKIKADFCDIFRLENGKIKELRFYVIEKK